jgi:hypothetical protein
MNRFPGQNGTTQHPQQRGSGFGPFEQGNQPP